MFFFKIKKNVYKLSGGNLYAEYGCFTGSSGAGSLLAGSDNYHRHVYQYVCTTDNCNKSHNLKFNLVAISALLFLSLAKFL